MSKYDRDIQDVYAVKQLGDAIGYGHLMAIAHELWARYLESKGLPRRGAHCVVGYPMVKEQFQAEALNDEIYTIIVGKALEADRKTEPQTCSVNGRPYSECSSCEHFRCTADEPQTELKGSKRLVKGSEEETEIERLDRIDSEIEDAWARIRELTPLDEPQTDCAWREPCGK